MNSFIAMAYRDLSCAAVALLITLVVGASFVESTAFAPAARASMSGAAHHYGQA